MSSALTLLAQLGCLLTCCLVLSQCTPARPIPPPAPQRPIITPPSPPPAPPVSAEELLNRFNIALDRA